MIHSSIDSSIHPLNIRKPTIQELADEIISFFMPTMNKVIYCQLFRTQHSRQKQGGKVNPYQLNQPEKVMSQFRIAKELSDFKKDPPANISASLVDEKNIYNWLATIIGPQGSPYQGGIFRLSINLPVDYPYHPPTCKFVTQVYHPNIGKDGTICLDILYQPKWSPILSVQKILLSISSLLTDPNPDHAMNSWEVSNKCKYHRTAFNATAKEWTMRYAK